MVSGIPGIGKSTWIQNHKDFIEGKTIVISRDEIRFSLLKDGDPYFSKEDETWAEYINQIKIAIDNNKVDNIFLDATHINPRSRNKVFKALGKKYLEKVNEINNIWFLCDVRLAIERNEKRAGTKRYVPSKAIYNMYATSEIPLLEEKFNNRYIVDAKNGMLIKLIEERIGE